MIATLIKSDFDVAQECIEDLKQNVNEIISCQQLHTEHDLHIYDLFLMLSIAVDESNKAEKQELSVRRLGSNDTKTSSFKTVLNDLKIESNTP